MSDYIDSGFIHDLNSLERLRAGVKTDEKGALREAAVQFEAIFTNMLFKSMRDANEAFESDLTSSNKTDFFQTMHDEQMASELSSTGSLGLADMIVEQLSPAYGDPAVEPNAPAASAAQDDGELGETQGESPLDIAVTQATQGVPIDREQLRVMQNDTLQELQARVAMQQAIDARSLPQATAPAVDHSEPFSSPDDFVTRMRPFAERAARSLGTDPAVLIAQAALETGWGQKVITNARGSSHNLFNIKAHNSWDGERMATRTLEFYDGIPVQETAAFRSYNGFQQSFDDYVRFLQTNPRYSDALTQAGEPEAFIQGLHQAGYATDPSYSEKVISVMGRVNRIMEESS
uniref:flagellar assembly peptidoglycan hydrolase FlgJ n=1 Tax=Thaumasiovibrio occultus TaxID=1891184 RepID=UPI000B35253F|nr:flagellar assembly peptidoglycan hydrolase FlgJ [Thaumasiovibrio occultus]